MAGCDGPPLPVELVCPLCKDLVDEAVMLPCCAAALCDQCAKKRILEENGKCHMCKDTVDPENLIPYRLLRDKVDKFLSISGYKRRLMASSMSKPASSRSPRGTSPPTPPPPPPPPSDIKRPPPPTVPCYPPPRTPGAHASSGHPQNYPQRHHSSRYSSYKEQPYYDDRQRHQYSRSVGWEQRDYRADHRTYISPSDDPLAAFQAAMAKMDYEKERSRTRSYYSPPRAYRKHSSSRPHRRERFESDIPPETREEREQRLEFERKLRKRAQREEDKVSWETNVNHCDEEFRKKGQEEIVGATSVQVGELRHKDSEGVLENGSTGGRKYQEKVDLDEAADGCKEVLQSDSTPSLSPETTDSIDKEGKEGNGDENWTEEDFKKGVEKSETGSKELYSVSLGGKSGDTEADDAGSSSDEDSVKEEEEPKKIVRSGSHSGVRSVAGEANVQDQCRLSTDDHQIKVPETSDSMNVGVDEDSVQRQEYSSCIKEDSAMREELKPEKLERQELMASSSESEEEKTIKKHAGSSDGGEVGLPPKRNKAKKQKKERKLQAEYEEKAKKAKKDKKAEKKHKKDKKSKKDKKVKKKKRKCKYSTSSSESDLEGGIEFLESKKKKKAKKSVKAPNVTIPLDLSQLRTMMRENLITGKELRRLMKATVKSEKEKKVTFKISEFSRNCSQDLMKVLFSKQSSGEKKSSKREASSSSSPESESKKSKKRETDKKAATNDEKLLSDLSGEENIRSKTDVKKNKKRSREESKHSRDNERLNKVGKRSGSEVSLARKSPEIQVEVDAERKEDEERQHETKLSTRGSREDKGGKDEISENRGKKGKKRKRRYSGEREILEPEVEKQKMAKKRGERVCKRKEDGMLEVKVENTKPVSRLLEERLVNDERLGKKLMTRLLGGKEEKQDMKERLGPIMPSRANKRSW